MNKYGIRVREIIASGLPRLWQHISENQFGIMSAFRIDKDMETNLKNDAELKAFLVQQGLGYIPAVGVWQGAEENSIFIPKISKELIQQLAAKYTQEAFIFGNEGNWALIETDSGETLTGGSAQDSFHVMSPDDVKDVTDNNKEIGYTKPDRDYTRPFTLQKQDLQKTSSLGGYFGPYFVHTIESLPYFAKACGTRAAAKSDSTYIHNSNGTKIPISWVAIFLPLE